MYFNIIYVGTGLSVLSIGLLLFFYLKKMQTKNNENLLHYEEDTKDDYNIPNMRPDDKFIFEIENNLDDDFCNNLIDYFNKNSKKQYDGVMGGGLNQNIKKTKDLVIKPYDSISKNIDEILANKLSDGIKQYNEHLKKHFNYNIIEKSTLTDTGYQMQKYKKNEGFYVWHEDFGIKKSNEINTCDYRMLTFIWYLNTVEEGGETYFLNGKIKPKKGSLVFFPATWCYRHKGAMPKSSEKYIITGWLYAKSSMFN